MISKKLKIFLTTFFFIASLFLLIGSAKAACYDFCSQKPLCDCGRQGTAGAFASLTGSACLIGEGVDLWCGWGTSEGGRGECTNVANTRKCKGDACPDEPGWNGQDCLVSTACGLICDWMQDCPGTWDARNKWCVECSGKMKTKRFGSSLGIDITCIDSTTCVGNGFDIPDTCETACDPFGVSPECDDATDGLNVPATHGIGVCNNCVFSAVCSWQNDACGQSPCDAYDRHQTCGPTGCSGGTCAPGNTRCVDDPACHPCEETCTCTCPKDSEGKEICPCTLGTCPPELRGGLVPCGKNCDDPCTKACECCPCTLCHLFVLFKRIVDFATLNILFPLAVLMIVVGGVMFLTAAGDPGRIGTAKKILTSVVIGLFIIFLAWLIVDTVITFLTPAGSPFQNWSTINCPVCGDGNCDSGETSENCPADCGAPPPPPPPPPAECPNGTCNVAGGECTTCPADCNVAACCGNGLCDVAVGETNGNCPADCPLPGCPPCIICP